MSVANRLQKTIGMLALAALASTAAGQAQPPSKDQPAKKAAAPTPAPAKTTPAPAAKAAPAQETKAPGKAATAEQKKAAPAAAAKKAPPKAPAKAPAKQAKPKVAKAPAKAPVVKEGGASSRRDPFISLVSKSGAGGEIPQSLPPGIAGLVIGSLTLNGIVRGPNGMIAVVTNPQRRVYFLREGARLYNGTVDKISLEGSNGYISFREQGKDAFGKPVERQLTRRLYPSAGEQP